MMRSRSLLWSFNYAIEGIVYALRTQRNMRIHVAAALLVLGASLFFRISRLEFIAVLFAIVFVFVTELVNTAVEAAVDVATQSFDPVAFKTRKLLSTAPVITALKFSGNNITETGNSSFGLSQSNCHYGIFAVFFCDRVEKTVKFFFKLSFF